VTAQPPSAAATKGQFAPLYAAGFVTAFGAHSIAANLGVFGREQHATLLTIGLLLAVYDAAEVVLKPVFGALTDRIGPRPVLLGGLAAFALASAGFLAAGDPGLLGAARLAQGVAAAAFSPAASTLVARLTPAAGHGRVFGSYGAWKGLGYTLGPLTGGGLVAFGGFDLLFGTLAVVAAVVAVWALVAVPTVPALPRARSTVVDLARRLTRAGFLTPTLALAGAAAALSVGVGFLPVYGAGAGLNAFATGALVSVLSAAAALSQPVAGRARDRGRLPDRSGVTLGLVFVCAGFGFAAMLSGVPGLLPACVLMGVGTGIVTPLAFAALASSAPQERLGATMGAAEVGRELGDAGGPLLVGAIAAATSLTVGLLGIGAVLLAAAGVIAAVGITDRDAPTR
jgi:MFS transporter, DHA1 family, tetracycline resistance protein